MQYLMWVGLPGGASCRDWGWVIGITVRQTALDKVGKSYLPPTTLSLEFLPKNIDK